ncbi:MAG: DNA-binding response OmpR family regulator [Halieaceae bacterium]|jgi:DNA-binding response OmpR family regulator
MNSQILIIDDDTELCELLANFLDLEGFSTHAIHNGAKAVDYCREHSADAIVLDIMLPGLQGLEVLRILRTFTNTPILMLTARGDDTDRIVGLEMGADDYLPKPCNPRELSARLRAILRRVQISKGDPIEICVGHTRTNSADRSAHYGNGDLQLTSAEFNILNVLLKNAGVVVAKETLSQEALGRALSAYDRSIDVHVSKIRKKLSGLGGEDLIISVRGAGYQFALSGAGVE